MKTEDGRRKAVSRRHSSRGIKTTHQMPKWQRDMKVAWKGFVRNARIFLMAIGFVTLLIVIANWLGGG